MTQGGVIVDASVPCNWGPSASYAGAELLVAIDGKEVDRQYLQLMPASPLAPPSATAVGTVGSAGEPEAASVVLPNVGRVWGPSVRFLPRASESGYSLDKICGCPAETVIVHSLDVDCSHAVGLASSKSRASTRGGACPPQWLPVLFAVVGMPPSQPTTAFDFSSATSPGWSNGGGDPPYAFTRMSGRTTSSNTGPAAGVDGTGSYLYAETSGGSEGKLFTLAYDGSVCSAIGQGVSTVAFHYHMYYSGKWY